MYVFTCWQNVVKLKPKDECMEYVGVLCLLKKLFKKWNKWTRNLYALGFLLEVHKLIVIVILTVLARIFTHNGWQRKTLSYLLKYWQWGTKPCSHVLLFESCIWWHNFSTFCLGRVWDWQVSLLKLIFFHGSNPSIQPLAQNYIHTPSHSRSHWPPYPPPPPTTYTHTHTHTHTHTCTHMHARMHTRMHARTHTLNTKRQHWKVRRWDSL